MDLFRVISCENSLLRQFTQPVSEDGLHRVRSCVMIQSQDAKIAPKNNLLKKNSQKMQNLLTFICFSVFVACLPCLLLFYTTVRISKILWMKLLANRFPHLDFVENVSVRTLFDTHRNQGIINILMTINGVCDPVVIKQALLENVIEKRDRLGNVRFPKLRSNLVSCWGSYAWRADHHFQLENHLVYASPKYRGRQLTDYNLQEYVNDIVKKYLSSHFPPWQVVIIPNVISRESKYCLLVRVHHLLVDDDEPLNIGDFLMLNLNEHRLQEPADNKNKSPLEDIVHELVALPTVYHKLNDSFTNRWNEFVSDFDPVQSPEVLKNPPSFFHFSTLLFFSVVSSLKEFSKYVSSEEHNVSTYFHHFKTTLFKEAKKRRLTFTLLTNSIINTFHPVNIMWKYFQLLWYCAKMILVNIPYCLFSEFIAFVNCIQEDYCDPNTIMGFLNNYLPLLISSAKEVIYISKILYTAPLSIVEELFFRDENEKPHSLQTVSTCGRKVVAWSQPVSAQAIKELAEASKVSETVILLAMTTACLKEYFVQAGLELPKTVLTTARTVSCDTLLSTLESKYGMKHASGLLCLSLPVQDIGNGDPAEDIMMLNREVERVRKKQGVIFALGARKEIIVKALPTLLARVALNYGSRKFSVALTEVAESEAGAYRETKWGQTMESFICWRPPQGNISLSLTIQRYAGAVRLGVMADALLAPLHFIPAKHWAEAIKLLQNKSHSIN